MTLLQHIIVWCLILGQTVVLITLNYQQKLITLLRERIRRLECKQRLLERRQRMSRDEWGRPYD